MAIAILNHSKLILHVKEIGFPIGHRMDLIPGGLGYEVFNKYIQENVEWINHIDFKKDEHIKLWTSAKVVGPVPSPENYYHRGVIGTFDSTSQWDFKDVENMGHNNYAKTTELLAEDYIVDYVLNEGGDVAVQQYIRVIVTEEAGDSYLGYGLTVPVERLWSVHYRTDGRTRFWVERSEFPVPEGEIEYYYVREIESPEERERRFDCKDGVWFLRVKEKAVVEDVEMPTAPSFTADEFDETENILMTDAMKATLKTAEVISTIKTN